MILPTRTWGSATEVLPNTVIPFESVKLTTDAWATERLSGRERHSVHDWVRVNAVQPVGAIWEVRRPTLPKAALGALFTTVDLQARGHTVEITNGRERYLLRVDDHLVALEGNSRALQHHARTALPFVGCAVQVLYALDIFRDGHERDWLKHACLAGARIASMLANPALELAWTAANIGMCAKDIADVHHASTRATAPARESVRAIIVR